MHMIGEKEKCTIKGNDKHEGADSLTQYKSYSMFVPNFKILGRVVPRKSLMEKSLHTDIQTLRKRQKLHNPYILCKLGVL